MKEMKCKTPRFYPTLVDRLPYSTDSYFHPLAFVFVSFMTNIKVTNMKNTAGKSATTPSAPLDPPKKDRQTFQA